MPHANFERLKKLQQGETEPVANNYQAFNSVCVLGGPT